jgi:hypothetical protein
MKIISLQRSQRPRCARLWSEYHRFIQHVYTGSDV